MFWLLTKFLLFPNLCLFQSSNYTSTVNYFCDKLFTVKGNIFCGIVKHEFRAYSRKGMHAIFQKKGKKLLEKGKIFENLCKNGQNL